MAAAAALKRRGEQQQLRRQRQLAARTGRQRRAPSAGRAAPAVSPIPCAGLLPLLLHSRCGGGSGLHRPRLQQLLYACGHVREVEYEGQDVLALGGAATHGRRHRGAAVVPAGRGEGWRGALACFCVCMCAGSGVLVVAVDEGKW